MKALALANHTRQFGAPTDWEADKAGECGILDIIDTKDGELAIMYSAWAPSMEEISSLLLGAPIWLGIVGTTHPVVSLQVGDPVDSPAGIICDGT